MIQRTAFTIGIGLLVGLSLGCQPETPEPIRCVCNCDTPPPEGAVVTVNEPPPEGMMVTVNEPTPAPTPTPEPPPALRPSTAAAPTPAVKPPPAVAQRVKAVNPAVVEGPGQRRAPPSVQPPVAPTTRRAAGKVSAEPGSGSPVVLTDKDKEEMVVVLKEFSNAAGARNLAGMQKWTTQRLGTSLESAVERHTERLFRRTDIFTKGAPTGVTVGQATNAGGGNHSVEFKFGNGESVNLMLFLEEGKWRLNRL